MITKTSRQKKEFSRIRKRLDALEADKRRNNFVIYGLKDEGTNNYIAKKNVIAALSEAEIHTDLNKAITRVFKKGGAPGRRPILVECNSAYDKEMIFEKVSTIKELGYVISHDATDEERENYRKLLTLKNLMKKKMGIVAKIKNDKIQYGEKFLNYTQARQKLIDQGIIVEDQKPKPMPTPEEPSKENEAMFTDEDPETSIEEFNSEGKRILKEKEEAEAKKNKLAPGNPQEKNNK